MKTGTKIFLIVLAIIIIALIAVLAVTVYQFKGLIEIIQDESIQQDFQSIAAGDCTKLPAVESRLDLIEQKVSSACKNPLIKIVILKQITEADICGEISNPDSEMKKTLNQMKSYCEMTAK